MPSVAFLSILPCRQFQLRTRDTTFTHSSFLAWILSHNGASRPIVRRPMTEHNTNFPVLLGVKPPTRSRPTASVLLLPTRVVLPLALTLGHLRASFGRGCLAHARAAVAPHWRRRLRNPPSWPADHCLIAPYGRLPVPATRVFAAAGCESARWSWTA